MNSILQLINFLLINNLLNKKKHKEIIFLLILRLLYIRNYYYLYTLNYLKNNAYNTNNHLYNNKKDNTNDLSTNNDSACPPVNKQSKTELPISSRNTEFKDSPNIKKDITEKTPTTKTSSLQTNTHSKEPKAPIPNSEDKIDISEAITNKKESTDKPTPNENLLFPLSVDDKKDLSAPTNNTQEKNISKKDATKNVFSPKSIDNKKTTKSSPDTNKRKLVPKNKENNPKISMPHSIKNSCSITSTIHQIAIANNLKESYLKSGSEFSCKITKLTSNTSSTKIRVPVLLSSCSIINIFQGDLKFSSSITDVTNINNMIYITDSTLIIDDSVHKDQGALFLDGYLKTSLDSLEPVNHCDNVLTSTYKNNIVCTPFSLSELVDLNYSISDNPQAFNNLQLDITTVSSDTKRILKKDNNYKDNKYDLVYKICELIIEVNYKVNIYKTDYITL